MLGRWIGVSIVRSVAQAYWAVQLILIGKIVLISDKLIHGITFSDRTVR